MRSARSARAPRISGGTMEFYSTNITVDVHDVDYNGVARASSLMRYIQSAAQSQLSDRGMSYDELRKMNRAFILSRIKLEFTESVHSYDRLTAETFPCESRGYTFLRCYKLKRGERTIGRGVSAWALIDVEKHSLVRVNDFDLGLETYAPLDLTLGRIALPTKLARLGEYTVGYADTDQNGHMNNTRYPDMFSSFLPLDGRRIESMTISYMNEAPMGSTLTVEGGEADGAHYFRTLRGDGKINAEAEIRLCDI